MLFWYTTPLPLTFFRSLSSSHIAREMLTYCHAPAHSCSRLIPCEDRALTIGGFSSLHRAERDVKYFHKRWTVYCPQMTQIYQIFMRRMHYILNLVGGSTGNMWARSILHFISLQVTVSHYNSHSAKGMSYLCTIERKGENGKRKTILAPGLLLEVSNFYSHKRLLRS